MRREERFEEDGVSSFRVPSESEEAVSAESAVHVVGNEDEVAAGMVVVDVGHPGVGVAGDGDCADGGDIGVMVSAADAVVEIGAGEVLAEVEETCEAAWGGAFVGDAEEIIDALVDAGGGDGATGGVLVEALALASSAAAGDDLEDVVGTDAGDLLLGVSEGDEVEPTVEDPEDLEHGEAGFFFADVGAFAGEGGFVDEETGEVAGGGAWGVEGGEGGVGGVGGVGKKRRGEEDGERWAKGVHPRNHGFLLKAAGGRAH